MAKHRTGESRIWDLVARFSATTQPIEI
jgi:hypothetical protein